MKKFPAKYDEYIEHAMKIGESNGWLGFEGKWPNTVEYRDRDRFIRSLEEQIEFFMQEEACIDAGKCPTCGGAITRRLDPRQVGPVELALAAGQWFNYRCAKNPPIGVAGPRTCEWSGVDRKEPIGEN